MGNGCGCFGGCEDIIWIILLIFIICCCCNNGGDKRPVGPCC